MECFSKFRKKIATAHEPKPFSHTYVYVFNTIKKTMCIFGGLFRLLIHDSIRVHFYGFSLIGNGINLFTYRLKVKLNNVYTFLFGSDTDILTAEHCTTNGFFLGRKSWKKNWLFCDCYCFFVVVCVRPHQHLSRNQVSRKTCLIVC